MELMVLECWNAMPCHVPVHWSTRTSVSCMGRHHFWKSPLKSPWIKIEKQNWNPSWLEKIRPAHTNSFSFQACMNCWNRSSPDQLEKPDLPTLDRPSTQTYRSESSLVECQSIRKSPPAEYLVFEVKWIQIWQMDWWVSYRWPLWAEGCCSDKKF